MDYQTFVTQQLIPRVLAALNNLKSNLVTAGVVANKITVAEVTTEGVNDLRYRITATRGAKTLTGYIELTAAGIINGAMGLVLTLHLDGNGVTIPLSFTSGASVAYNETSGIDFLLSKLSQIETVTVGELLTATKTFLGV